MFIWDQENIGWMEAAAEYTGYYDELARIIQPFLRDEDHLCEIGCGLGHLACAIANNVSHVTAVDISEKAIEQAKGLAQSRGIKNLTLITDDWTKTELLDTENFDVVILSYISAIRKDWSKLSKLSKGLIIAVLANGESGTGLQSSLYNPIYEDLEGRDTIVNVVPFLRNRGISYKLIECELEYGQPLVDIEEACRFASRYYEGDEKELREYLKRRLRPIQNGYYLPKIKKSGILIIDRQEKP